MHVCRIDRTPQTEAHIKPENVATTTGVQHPLIAMAHFPKPKLKSPHTFVLEALASLNPEVRRMFSGFAVYIGDRLVFMLRDHTKYPEDNGVWLVLSEDVDPADVSLRRDFPSIRAIRMLGSKINHWLLIPSDSADFEKEALDACELIRVRDPRLGRILQSRR